MANVNFTQTNMARFTSLVSASDIRTVNNNLSQVFNDGGNANLNTVEDIGNFSYRGSYGNYTVKGSFSMQTDPESGAPITAKLAWNSFIAEIDTAASIPHGTYQFLGSANASLNIDTGIGSISLSSTGYSFKSSKNQSSWQITSKFSGSVKIDLESGLRSAFIQQDFTRYTYTADNGDKLEFTGKFTYDESTDELSGFITSMRATVEGVSYASPAIKMSVKSLGYGYDAGDLLVYILAGNDVISMNSDVSKNLEGFAGNDTINGNEQNNRLFGGQEYDNDNSGRDTIFGYGGNDYIQAGDGTDSLVGGDGNDTIYGGAGKDRLFGQTGNDDLDGGDGHDSIEGRDGNDWITGGSGKDTLIGGAGQDVFIFETENLSGRNMDLLRDFKVGEDRIVILDLEYQPIKLTAQNFVTSSGNSSASTSGQNFIYNTSNGILYYDPDSAGPKNGIAIVELIGKPVLAESSFMVW